MIRRDDQATLRRFERLETMILDAQTAGNAQQQHKEPKRALQQPLAVHLARTPDAGAVQSAVLLPIRPHDEAQQMMRAQMEQAIERMEAMREQVKAFSPESVKILDEQIAQMRKQIAD